MQLQLSPPNYQRLAIWWNEGVGGLSELWLSLLESVLVRGRLEPLKGQCLESMVVTSSLTRFHPQKAKRLPYMSTRSSKENTV